MKRYVMTDDDLKEENDSKKAGQPPIWDDPIKMQKKIDEYFINAHKYGDPPTISGLCYNLGFESRQSFYDYEKRESFSYTIKRARLRMESIYETKLHGNSNAGSIFALKNFGWVDTQSLDHTSNGKEMKGFTLNVKPDTE